MCRKPDLRAAGEGGDGAVDTEMIWRETTANGKAERAQRVYWNEKRRAKGRNDITMAEVAEHSTLADGWIVVDGRVYDVTKYVASHPGGVKPIACLLGKDATDAFANYHPAAVYEKSLPNFYVGDVADAPKPTAFAAGARAIRQRMLEAGWFETEPGFYLKLGAWIAGLFLTALYLTVVQKRAVAGAVATGMFWQQLAFIGHDLGHSSVSHKKRVDTVIALIIGNPLGGIAIGWWKWTHNVHHVVPNSVEHDPDNQHLPIFAVDHLMLDGFFSEFHNRDMPFCKVAANLVVWQPWTYYVVMVFARFNLYVQSWLYVLGEHCKRDKAAEAAGLLFFAFGIAGIGLNFGSWKTFLTWLLLAHVAGSLLEIQITLSHFAETVYGGLPGLTDDDEWYVNQVRTTLNIDCYPWLDWVHGGLQFQTEHHLWPRLPRHRLRAARDLLKPLCEQHGVEYNECTFFEANIRVLTKLSTVAKAAGARAAKSA